jgi:hypothetical protein
MFAIRSHFFKNKERTVRSKKGGALGRRRRIPMQPVAVRAVNAR